VRRGAREAVPAAVLGAVLAASAAALFCVWFVAQERWIYFWDWSGYWRKTIDLASHLRHDVPGALAMVLRTVRRDDYNVAPVLPLASIAVALGVSRLAYVASIAVLYGVTAMASLALFAERAFLRPLGASFAARLACGTTIALLPLLWVPTLIGLPDVVGCVVMPFAWWLVRGRPSRLPPRRVVAAALLLALLVVLRRWYAYWAVALVVALALEAVLEAEGRRALAAAGGRLAALGGIALGAFLLVTGAHGVAMMRTDYGALYVAYGSADPTYTAAVELWRRFGPIPLVLALGGAALGLASPAQRATTRLMLVQAAVVILTFARTQTMNAHHYTMLVAIVVLAGVCAARAIDAVPAGARSLACTMLVAVLATSFSGVLAPGIRPALGPVAAVLPAIDYAPLVRDDLEQVGVLVRRLDDITRAGNDKVYVLSSSMALNEEVLANAHLVDPTLPALDERILPTSHLDLRDGFPWALAMARFVVVTDPVGYHLDPSHQRVVGVPAREILRGSTIGGAYAPLPGEVLLADGTRVLIFVRTRDLRDDDFEPLLAELRSAHPGAPGFGRR
jgi:hypothetical protein